VQALVGEHHALSASPPLTSDLWATGVLMCYLYLGCTVLDPVHYVDLASDGLAVTTAHKPPRAQGAGRRRRRSMSSYLASGSLIGRVSGALSQFFTGSGIRQSTDGQIPSNARRSQETAPSPPARAQIEPEAEAELSGGSATRRSALGQAAGFGDIASLQLQQLHADERPVLNAQHRMNIAHARAEVEAAGSVAELVNIQLALLAACGASKSASQI
jgi:hypothetical protein